MAGCVNSSKFRVQWACFFAILLAGFLGSVSAPPIAGGSVRADQLAAETYQEDFGVSKQTAEERLAVQERGAAIVERLQLAQGKRYAGVWFDNESGEFVVPTVQASPQSAITAAFGDARLAGEDFRTKPVQSTWQQLESEHKRIDAALLPLIEDQLLFTSLDPRTNAVVLHEAAGTEEADRVLIKDAIAGASVRVEVRREGAERFSAHPLACNTYSTYIRVCDKPLRAGVFLGMYNGPKTCTAGFKAIGNTFGNRFMLTAGHCGVAWNDWESRDGSNESHYIGEVDAATYPGGDWAAIRVKGTGKWWEEGTSWPSEVIFWGGNQHIPITYEGSSYVGQYVCHSGIIHGSSCGFVTGFDITQTYDDGGTVHHLTKVEGNELWVEEGHSGGPIWAGNTALGLASGAVEVGQLHAALYVEITEATDSMGVTVGQRVAGGPPSAQTNDATNVAGTQVTGNGKVDPNGTPTSYQFEYGTTPSFGNMTSSVGAGSSHGAVTVSQPIAGLDPVTTYNYRLVATNNGGTQAWGATKTFTTTAAPPISTTEPAEVLRQEATLKAKVNPQGAETHYYFQYGPTASYGQRIPAVDAYVGKGIANVALSQKLTALEDGTYHFRVVASNSKGTTYGADREFLIDNRPLVTTEGASSVQPGSATLAGKVNPQNFASTYRFELVPDADYKADGFSYPLKVPVPDKSAGAGIGDVSVSEPTGALLEPQTTYHYRLVATNVKGTRIGAEKTFKTPALMPVKDLSWGSVGTGNGQFGDMSGLAVDGAGNVWVADYGNSRVQKFDAAGNYLSQFGKYGTGNGEFNQPYGVAIAPSGDLWVADPFNDRIQKFNSKGEYLSKIGSSGSGNGQFDWPGNVAVDPGSGDIWVADFSNSRLQQFDSTGKFIRAVTGGGGNGPALAGPMGLAFDKTGNVWVADASADRVVGYTPAGAYVAQVGSSGPGNGQFLSPVGIDFLPSGDMLVADGDGSMGGRVQQLTASGEYLNTILSNPEGPQPRDIAVVGNVIYVTETGPGVCRVTKLHIPQVKASTSPAQNVKARRATLAGTVNPNGAAATYRFEYGQTKAYGTSIPVPAKALGSETGLQEVQEEISGLSPSATYHYRLVASNTYGTSYGGDKTLTMTAQQAPASSTEAASSLAPGEATLNASVNPNEAETTYRFDYGKTTNYGKTAPSPVKSAGSGFSAVKVSETIKALEPNTTYHFRLSATNEAGTTKGEDQTFTTPRAVSAAPTLSFAFGSAGSGNGQFIEPRGIAIDSKGDVWLVDSNGFGPTVRVQKFNSKGEYLSKFGSFGSGNGQLDYPTGIVIDKEDNVYVADTGNTRVQKFNSKGEYLSKFTSAHMTEITDIALDPQGNIWLTDVENGLLKFNSKGEFQLKTGAFGTGSGQLREPRGLATDADGNIWVADTLNNRVQQFGPKGEFLAKFGTTGSGGGQFGEPRGIAVDARGTLWVSSSTQGRVQKIYPEGEYVSQFGTVGTGTGQFKTPTWIETDAEGKLWVADSGNKRVQAWKQAAAYPVETEAASGVKRTEATLNATINPQGAATSYQFEYGTTASFGKVAPASPKSIGSGSAGVKVGEALNGLKSGTTYYYHVVATTAAGTTYGETRRFSTHPGPGAEAKWRIGGKTFAELGLSQESFATSGSFAIEIPTMNATFKCTETGNGTLISSGPSVIHMSLACTIPALPGCKLQPIKMDVDGKFKSLNTNLTLITGEGCGFFSGEIFLPNGTGSFDFGTEGWNLNVIGSHTTTFGAHSVYITGSSYWQLSGANAGKSFGVW
jgi:sugar lactone lactonase YvrE/phosphodiesterase/alkaline phosphatase D-like protein